MKKRPLGRNGPLVSEIGLGCWNLAGAYGPTNEDEARATLKTAIDGGITFLDTANVYGMGLTSDPGVFATKPYIGGSNYLLKMGDFGRGTWCDVVDGLYWRFVERNRAELERNPRLAIMPRGLDRLKPERRTLIFAAAERFLAVATR